MKNKNKKNNILSVLVNAIDYETATDEIISFAHKKEPMNVEPIAVHGIVTGFLDKTHLHRLNSFDMLLPDGQPVRWGLNLLYNTKLKDRVYGPTLMLKICERASREGLKIYLYGSREIVLKKLSENLCKRFPSLLIAGLLPCKFERISIAEHEAVIETIKKSGASITFVGMGCPKQDVWIYENKNRLSMPLIAVGAAFDFHAGIVPQSPPTLQNIGLEWFYRLIHEPKRLWKRYLIFNPLYIFLFLLQMMKIKKFSTDDTTPPLNEVRYG
ncbi:MAG: WecB/TagA/CpsF family glycosyltransferase [Desulfobacterales bacterium]|nr:WecB/TagA/CpsF family glycosyltransferase [Desulfobacterales bacterium]